MKNKTLGSIFITLLIGIILYYFMLPAMNLSDPLFWVYIVNLVIVYYIVKIILKRNVINKKKNQIIPEGRILGVAGIIICVIIIMNIILSPMFNAKTYSKRITIDETKEFAQDVKEVDFSAVPLLDKASSRKLGDRTMGQMTDLVSQFTVSELYTQINYNNEIVRVTPLEYAGFIKYMTNRDEGVKGYITVNSVNGESKLVKLDKGMKYMPSAHFFENLNRKLRISYPTEIFGEETFEIDNEGNPYWIVPTIKYVGVGMRKEISGIIIFNAVSGESEKYKAGNIPAWVDHVYDPELIIEQFNNWGEYRGGYWNSIFGQKNVVNTTEGYNYLVMDDDVFLYTGITSVSTDESNLGFILTNMRTKETKYYLIPGAEEYSAMASAQGLVQEKDYESTFPLLINLNGKPTYLLSLKDNAGLVKMYAFVDVVDYQKVVTSDASLGIEAAAKKYLGEIPITVDESKLVTETIEVKSIKTAVINGTTNYYITDKENKKYSVSITVDANMLPFVEVGSKLTVTYTDEKIIRVITSIK